MPKGKRNRINNTNLVATYYIKGEAFHVHGIYSTPETPENEWDLFSVMHKGNYLTKDFYEMPTRLDVMLLAERDRLAC